MAPSATGTQQVSTKVKRPVPPGIQTNGINSTTSSPSPSISASRLPNATPRNTSGSSASNGVPNGSSGSRSASRIRRDAPTQLLGRGQRNSSVGLRSASLVGEPVMTDSAGPQPYVLTDEHILSKFKGSPPSLIIHLHQNHFRFDQQDGSFTYKSPMRMVIEHLRRRTVPHDLLEFMPDVPFYDGCMIVQIYDHKSIAPSQGQERSSPTVSKTTPFSVHNTNPWVTQSSYVPFQSQSPDTGKPKSSDTSESNKTAEEKDKENMPAPNLPGETRKFTGASKEPKVITMVLHPTQISNHIDLALKVTENRTPTDDGRSSRQDLLGGPLSATVPPTPTTGMPSTPQLNMPPPAKRQKKSRGDLDSNNIYAVESQIIVARTAELNLDPVSSPAECAALLKSLAHPMHNDKPPPPKSRKRTVAEMAADEALAADQERFMLVLDERANASGLSGSANPVNGEGPAGGAVFEPRFERFKVIENIRKTLDETKRQEKLRREEQERKQRAEAERNKLEENSKRVADEKNRIATAQQASQQQQNSQAEINRRRMVVQAVQANQGLQGAQGGPAQATGSHAHPPTNGMGSQPQRFHQSVSQGQTSSPIVRNGTPHSHSSPTVNNMGNAPMQPSTSSMGGSPPRPGSVVQQNHHPMGAPTPQNMATQRSQQSHAGTPRMQTATPNIQSTPLNRQMSQTPRLNQGSPLQGPMGQIGSVQMVNGQPVQLSQQQMQHLQAQKMASMLRNQQAAQAQGMGMMNGGHPITQQQMQMLQQQAQAQAMRAQQQQQFAGQQPNNQALQQQYAASMAMNGRSAANIPQGMNQNFMNGMAQMNPQQLAQVQQLQIAQQQRQQHQQQLAAQNAQQQQLHMQQQQQHHIDPGSQSQSQAFTSRVQTVASQLYIQQRQMMMSRYPTGLPPEVDRELKNRCSQIARQQVGESLRAQQQQQQQLAAQNQRMSAMQNGGGM